MGIGSKLVTTITNAAGRLLHWMLRNAAPKRNSPKQN
jgi:hypothetical protein